MAYIESTSNPSAANGYNTPTSATPPVTRYTTPTTPPEPYSGLTAPTLGTVDENAIREQTRQRMQTSVDAINAQYANLISQEQVQGADRTGQTRATNARSGLIGSDFGQAQQEKTTQFNKQQVQTLENEKAVKVTSVLQNIEDRASSEIQARKQEALGQYQIDSEAYKQTQGQAREDLKTLAASGADLSQLSPAQKAALFKQAGYDEGMGEVIYNAMKPQAQKIDYKFEKLSDGQGLFYGVDPVTGELKQQRVSVPVPPGYSLTIAPDGTPLIFNKDTGEAKVADGFSQSQFAKPEDGLDAQKKQLEIEKLKKDLSGRGDLTPAQQGAAFKLVDDYEKASGDFSKVTTNYNRVVASAKNPSAAGDLSLIFAYMKTLDPTSVVREGEFATAATAGSIPDRIWGTYNKIINGERLSEPQRADFVARAKELYNAAIEQQKMVDSQFSDRAQRFGIDPSYVVRNQTSFNEQPATVNLTPLSGPLSPGASPLVKKYPYQEVVQYLQANPNATEADIRQGLQELGFNSVGKTSASTGMRTDRHNNPTAFTTDIAKAAGLQEGKDYIAGDPFSNGKYKTAKILGDPVATTIKVIDKIGFYTQSGKPRWTYVNSIPQAKNWNSLSYSQKSNVIKQMYQHEGGSKLLNNFA
jgi:hypothetical protein